jgi:hypothetical protein
MPSTLEDLYAEPFRQHPHRCPALIHFQRFLHLDAGSHFAEDHTDFSKDDAASHELDILIDAPRSTYAFHAWQGHQGREDVFKNRSPHEWQRLMEKDVEKIQFQTYQVEHTFYGCHVEMLGALGKCDYDIVARPDRVVSVQQYVFGALARLVT